MPTTLSSHLLRTLAAVPPSDRILELGCSDGQLTAALHALGFDLFACSPRTADVERTRTALDADDAQQRITPADTAALGYPDDYFDWVIAYGAYDEAADLAVLMDQLAETLRVLKPGGWVYVAMREETVGEDATPEALTKLFEHAGYALAERPVLDQEGEPVLRGIYRKVDATTPY